MIAFIPLWLATGYSPELPGRTRNNEHLGFLEILLYLHRTPKFDLPYANFLTFADCKETHF